MSGIEIYYPVKQSHTLTSNTTNSFVQSNETSILTERKSQPGAKPCNGSLTSSRRCNVPAPVMEDNWLSSLRNKPERSSNRSEKPILA
mmetsp:Transcript_12341/g.19873  ORF Transcript_12341/g.19873 Transcript_12341/m.19873 type:complete len:88 (+) Transcript_12341:255-518(+)